MITDSKVSALETSIPSYLFLQLIRGVMSRFFVALTVFLKVSVSVNAQASVLSTAFAFL